MGIPRTISPVHHMALGETKRENSLSVFCIPLVIVVAVVVELAVGEEEGETGSGGFVVLIVGLVYDYVYIIICSIAYLIPTCLDQIRSTSIRVASPSPLGLTTFLLSVNKIEQTDNQSISANR